MLIAPAAETQCWLVDIVDATDVPLCGGKAAGLARLEQAGWAVPAAICVTTDFYRRWLAASGLAARMPAMLAGARDAASRRRILEEIRVRMEAAPLPDDLEVLLGDGIGRLQERPNGPLSVRSSGVDEDDHNASHAGIHSSLVVAGDDLPAIVAAIKTCWASPWTEAAWTYRERLDIPHSSVAMAVVIQRFVPAECSGVAFSADPLTNERMMVVIEAGWGSGAALVGGRMTPDEYRVSTNGAAPLVVHRRTGRQTTMTVWRDGRETAVPLDETRRERPVLDEGQVLQLARAVKLVERALGQPVDVEWVFDGRMFWAVQARPITALVAASRATPRRPRLWTRANLKEVFPELPSPLALSYLAISLNRMFRSYHAANGYSLPDGANLVSVIHGRPYLNLSLMQDLAIERGGNPAIVGRLLGGGSPAPPTSPVPAPPPRLSLRGHARLAREMLATFFRTPARGRRLFRIMRAEAALLASVSLEALDDSTLTAHFERLGASLLDETPLRRLHEVVSAQSRAYMVLEALLTAWIPTDADTVMKRLMTGLGTLPNVQMTYRLMELGALAAQDRRACAYFTAELGQDSLRGYADALAGTAVLRGLEAFLQEFGHRGPYESDVMSPRFAEDPAPVLRLIQLHMRAGARETAARHVADRRRVRRAAMAEVRRALHQGRGRLAFAAQWTVFSIVCNALQRLLALRDECRHVTTMLVAHIRRVVLEIGRRASRAGTLADPNDVFFLTWEEIPRILAERDGAWRAVTADRRRQRDRDMQAEAPDVVSDDGPAGGDIVMDAQESDELVGYGVSPGIVTGRIRVLNSIEGIGRLSGEIVVFPAIEPTLALIFPLVGGFIAEMGGLLSHAAILAREYGLPAIVSVRDATRRLRDGDRVELDGTSGRIRVLERAG